MAHGLRGRLSNRAHAPQVREQVLALAAEPLYAGTDPRDAHRPLPPGIDLEALFAETETRVVGRDCTVRWKNGFWQIPEAQARAAGVRPGLRIVVEQRLSGDPRFRRGGAE